MASKAERLRLAYESKLGKDLVSKLSDNQIKLLSRYYNSLSNSEQSNIDNRIFKGYSDTDLHEMARGFIQEEKDTEKIPEGLDDILKKVRSEKKESAGALAVVNGKKFFGEDRYDKYYSEIIQEGRLGGDNLSPQERKEGLKAYKKSKIDFKTFVNRVLDQKNQVNVGKSTTKPIGSGGGALVVRRSQIQTNNFVPIQQQSEQNLDEILKGIDSILNTLKEEEKVKKKESDRSRRESEKRNREAKEKRLEQNVFGNLFTTAKKILKPVKSIFQRIFEFVSTVLLGRILFKLVDWMSDKENQKKLEAIGNFLSKTWPALLAAYLIFGNGLGRFVTRMLGMTLRFIPKIAMAIARLAAAHPIAATALAGAGLFAAGAVIPKLMPETVDEQERKTESQPGTKKEKIERLKQQKANLNLLQRLQGVGAEIDEQIYKLETGKVKGYSGGGRAMGTDTVPAMLTPGEFVMSKGAVDMFGADTFASMNAAGGGTNRPKSFGGRVYAQGGGGVAKNRQPNERQPSTVAAATGGAGTGLTGLTAQDFRDLAFIVSGEAQRGTNDEYGVAAAVLNRVADPRFPNTIKAVGAAPGQFEAVYKGLAKDDPKLAAKLASAEGQKKIAGALNTLKGRTDFKGVSQYANMGSGDVKFSSRGNFYHYSNQVGKNDPPPSPLPTHYKKFLGAGGKAITLAGTTSSGGGGVGGSGGGGSTGGGGGSKPKTDWSKVKTLGSDYFSATSGTNQGIASGSPAVLGRNKNKLKLPSAPPSVRTSSVSTVPSSSGSSEGSSTPNSTGRIPNIPMLPPSMTKAKVLGVSVG